MSDQLPGALVISLDFELAWGFGRNAVTEEACRERILAARTIIPQLLDIFEEFDVAATWAVVGFLFAESRAELQGLCPHKRPDYRDPDLSTYGEEIGEDEREDPFHFAPSLIRAIQRTPRQEIATHTFSHYYCLEPGQTKETFSADIQAARAAARRFGIQLHSIAFPRNQHNPEYDEILIEQGITGFRGNPRNWAWRFSDTRESRKRGKRALRLIDAYLPMTGVGTVPWEDVLQPSGLADVRATRPLSPYRPEIRHFEEKRFQRIRRGILHAAQNREIFHLWWHPHNFGIFQDHNMAFLREVLREATRCRAEYGLRLLSMADVGRMVRESPTRFSARLTRSR